MVYRHRQSSRCSQHAVSGLTPQGLCPGSVCADGQLQLGWTWEAALEKYHAQQSAVRADFEHAYVG
jgi:hypothetical protein